MNEITAKGQSRETQEPELRSTRSSRSHGSVSGTAIASYFGVFLLVVTLIAVAYHPPVSQSSASAESLPSDATVAPVTTANATSVDKLVATGIASSLAESVDLPVSNNIANLSQSLAVESVLAQTDTSIISKPQIVQPMASSQVVQQYVTVAGDTVDTVAQKFAISATTVKWSNNLSSDALEPNKTLTILPADGILYTTKSGDTISSIATKYGANADAIVAYNNLELQGEPAQGVQIVVPGGVLPENERPGYVAPRTQTVVRGQNAWSQYSGGTGSAYRGGVSAGNKYAWGYCTWYAYERRAQLGREIGSFWGNASTWANYARSSGFMVDGNPAVGAIMQNGGGYGHVAIVESVDPGVSITISEMNGYRFGGGFARVGTGNISWGEATSGMYRYIH